MSMFNGHASTLSTLCLLKIRSGFSVGPHFLGPQHTR